jgi:hypothetical protein
MFSARTGLIAASVFQVVTVLAGSGLFSTAAGAAIGCGMLSKLTMLALPIGVAGFVLTRHRSALRHGSTYVGAALSSALFVPVLAWNAANGWAALRYVRTERMQQVASGLHGLGAIVIEQLAFTGVMFLVLWWTIARGIRRRADDRMAFLLWLSVPTFVLMAVVVYGAGGAHGYWLVPAYLALAVALGAVWPGRVAAGIMAANAALFVYATLAPHIPALPAVDAATESVSGWREAAARVDDLAAALPRPVVLAVPIQHFEAAGHLTYHTRQRYPVTVLPEPYRGSVWPHPAAFRGVSIIWIVERKWTIPPPERYLLEPQERGSLPVFVRGREIRRFSFWTARAFRVLGTQ